MTTLKRNILCTVLVLISSRGLAKDLTQTDLDKVYNSGTGNSGVVAPINLSPGVYAIGDDSTAISGSHFLIVDKYVNDESRFLAILVEQNSFDSLARCPARFLMGKKIKGGSSIMFSPIFIDINGNLAIESELKQDAQVIEITARTDGDLRYRYPYLVQGHYGALGGKLYGMRAKSTQSPNLKTWPSNNIFQGSAFGGDNNLLVTGTTVAVHNGRGLDQRFELLPINGDFGKFAQLVTTQLDTMGEYMTSETQVQKLAFFLTNTSGEEVFIIANPSPHAGEFVMEFYGPKRRNLFDFLFPGLKVIP